MDFKHEISSVHIETLKPEKNISGITDSKVFDDNGKEYGRNGVFLHNNTFIVDGRKFETDDNGHIYKVEDQLKPNDSYVLDNIIYRTDSEGNTISSYESSDIFLNDATQAYMDPFGWGPADREDTNESDGQHLWGYDNEDGTTTWYTDDEILDSITPTPFVDEDSDEISPIVDEVPEDIGSNKKGGSYGEVFKEGEGDQYEVHHMPSDSASPLERNDGPSIKMEKADHRQTESCGGAPEACEYRAIQQELISEGKFREALQMDIDDIHEKFSDKYDDAIAEMLTYVNKLEMEGKI